MFNHIRDRYKLWLTTWSIATGICLALMGGAAVTQHFHDANRKGKQVSFNITAGNRERLWAEATGSKAIPESGDVVDKLAGLLKPPMTDAMKRDPQLNQSELPNAIATANIAPNTLSGISTALNWCILNVSTKGVCTDQGPFNDSFRRQIQDVLSGNLNAHLHQTQAVTYHRTWPHPSREDLLLWWFLISTPGWLIAAINDNDKRFTTDEIDVRDGHARDVRGWVETGRPHFVPTDWVKLPILLAPITLAYTFGFDLPKQYGGNVIHFRRLYRDRKTAKTNEAEFIAAHPLVDDLLTARRVRDELLAMPDKHKEDETIKAAIKAANKEVERIENIPEMMERDEARLKATELMKELIPSAIRARDFTENHKQLMAGASAQIDEAIAELPSTTKRVKVSVNDVMPPKSNGSR